MESATLTRAENRPEMARPAFLNRQLALRDVEAARGAYQRALERLVEAMPEHVTMTDVLTSIRAGADQTALVEAKVLAVRASAGVSDRSLEKLAADTGLSKADARRAARRAKAVAENADLAAGGLTTGQLDVIADISARSDGAAAVDPELIDAVANRPPDQGRRLAAQWERDRQTADSVQTEHDRQHKLRRARRWVTDDGAHAITATGSRAHIDLIWQQIQAKASRLYRADGGRDVAGRNHPRTRDQRLFDAFHGLLVPGGESSAGGPDGTAVHTRGARPVTVVTVDIDRLQGAGGPPAELIGCGPLPDTMLADIVSRSDLVGAVFGRMGEVLWLGRRVRHATAAQRLALALRDRGCVLCGVEPSRCQAHHIMPWEAPGKGQTNIDELALVCDDDHHRLHDLKLTLVHEADGTWSTRPATREEIAPSRPDRK